MLKAVQVALVFAAAVAGIMFFGVRTYAYVAVVIFVLALVVLVTVEQPRDGELTFREGLWVGFLSVLAGAMWCAWPLIVVFGFFGGRGVAPVDEPLQDLSTARRKSEEA